MRVPRPDKTRERKFFGDRAWGSRSTAYKQAVAHRNYLEMKYGLTRTNRWHVQRPCSNQTGVKGVRRATTKRGDMFIVDATPQTGKQKRTSISIRKHGEANAFDMACRKRMGWEMEIFRG